MKQNKTNQGSIISFDQDSSRAQPPSRRQSTIDNRQSTIDNRQSTIDSRQSTVGSRQSATRQLYTHSGPDIKLK